MKKTTEKSIRYIARAGVIAALYVALTAVSAAFGMASGTIQVRISEALCILPVITSAAVPGVTVGCIISNLIFGGTVYDIIFGSLATLIGAALAMLFKKLPYLASIPTILSNAIIIPAVLIVSGIGIWPEYPWIAFTVGLGELISCGILGGLLLAAIKHNRKLSEILSK